MRAFLVRLGRVLPRMAARPARWISALLGKPGWPHWGVIFAGLNVAATIVVALTLIGFTCELERRRHGEATANFSASVDMMRPDDADGHWFVELRIVSEGPATAHGAKITIEAGDWGIMPLNPAVASRGAVSNSEDFAVFDPDGHTCYSSGYTVIVKDDIFSGDSVTISHEFAAEEWRDLELRQDPSLHWGGVGGWEGVSEQGSLRWGLITISSRDQPLPIIKAFLPSVNVVGDSVDFPEWRTEWRCR